MTTRFDYIARMKRAKGRHLKQAFYVEDEGCDGLRGFFVEARFFALRAQNDKKAANAAELRKIAKLCATKLAGDGTMAPWNLCGRLGGKSGSEKQ